MRFILILLLALLVGCDAQAKPKRPNPPLPPKNTPAPKADTVEVLDFTAKWCKPCKRNEPAIQRLEREGHKIIRIDIDEQPAVADSWRVVQYPTYIIVVNGKETFRTSDPVKLRARLQGKKLPRL